MNGEEKEAEFDFGSLYHVVRRIGEGASGVVYLAQVKKRKEPVAIKFLREQYRNDPDVVQRFITERSALLDLNGTNIVRVEDLIAEGGKLGIVMEYVPGVTLGEYLSEKRTLSPLQAVRITEQVANALTIAHDHGIVHRDIKPDNIILTKPQDTSDPGVKIADFGIAKIVGNKARTTQIVGTPHYMAPELITDGKVSGATDIYALGITLYQMLTGKTPFGGPEDNPFTIAHHHLYSQALAIEGLSDDLNAVLHQMMAKTAGKRPTASESRKMLQDCEDTVAALPPLPYLDHDVALHPATVLKPAEIASDSPEESGDEAPAGPPELDLPQITPAANATVMRPMPLKPREDDITIEDTTTATPSHNEQSKRRTVIIAIASLVVLAVIIAAIFWARSGASGKKGTSGDVVSATLEQEVLPSGLIISRQASWDDKEQSIDYKITYRTSKVPIAGAVMETITDGKGKCLPVTWSGVETKRHSRAITSIDANCGWTFNLPKLSSESPFVATAKVKIKGDPPANEQELENWLQAQRQSTEKALEDSNTVSTSYPLQRLKEMRISIPQRILQGKPIPATIVGIWPNGENNMEPVYTTPDAGDPTSVLTDITGGDMAELRFTDRCSGAIAITADGHDLSALRPASCDIGATIGNYDLPETPIVITSAGS